MTLRGLVVAPHDGVANAWLGWSALYREQDWGKAGQQYERATRLDPTNVDIIRGAVQVLLDFGRLEDARALGGYLITHDPLCAICIINLTNVHLAAENFDAAVASAQRAVALAPQNQGAQFSLGVSLLVSESPHSAISQVEASPFFADYFTLLESDGTNGQMETRVGDFRARWPKAHLVIATAYARAGQTDRAFELLDEMLREGTQPPLGIYGGPYDPLLKNLKLDPRWQTYLEKIGRSSQQLAKFDFKITRPE
jgi:pentatricopeptide repeat protein